MSLFKTKEWWRTSCGANESFDGRSLLVAPLFGSDRKDAVVVGSHEGFLRIYGPSSRWLDETTSPSGYRSTDLLIESRVCDCIVDLKVGRFVSGSQDLRLAILTPARLVVYVAILRDGSTEEGDRCELEVAYEHPLTRFPARLITGSFGGVRGRDFLCVQCIDGTLLFYEQEVFAFEQVLPNRLLPEPMVYVPRSDLFVSVGSSWLLEGYRYQSMAESFERRESRESEESGKNGGRDAVERIEPDWCYNIGEAALDVQAVPLSSFEVAIVVLGERSLYCLKDGCASLKYSKRLDYRPVCFRAYVIEPDGKLMVLVVADTSTLVLYEGTTVRWSAQLPLLPVAVTRARLELEGALIALSEDGRLEACYLGSEPALFVAPGLSRRWYDYEAAERELAELRGLLAGRRSSADERAESSAGPDEEERVTVTVNVSTEPSRDRDDDVDRAVPSCVLAIEISSYTILRDVQISVAAREPLVVEPDRLVVPNLCDRRSFRIAVRLAGDSSPATSEIDVTVSHRTGLGHARVLRRTARVPPEVTLRSCPPENSATFAAVLRLERPIVGLSRLFPEFTIERSRRQNCEALGLRHARTGRTVTVVAESSGNRYRVRSKDGPSTTLVIERLVGRLRDVGGAAPAAGVARAHLGLVHELAEAHFLARRRIEEIAEEIALLTSQLRNVERKMLRTVRERNERSLADGGLPFLLESTYRATFARLEDLAGARAERERTGRELGNALRLLVLLSRAAASDETRAALEATVGFEPGAAVESDWEEIVDVALTGLLRRISRKSGPSDARAPTWRRFGSSKDLGKLKKRIVHAIERIAGCRESEVAELELTEERDDPPSESPGASTS